MNQFVLSEVLLFIVPPFLIYLIQTRYRQYLKFFDQFPLNLAIVLLPLWLMLIHIFSLLIFSYSLVNFCIFLTSFALGLHLYDYVRYVQHFSLDNYYLAASQVIFIMFTAFLFGLMILRIYTYF